MKAQVVAYDNKHFDGVASLWKEAFPNDSPWNAAEVAIPEKMRFQPDLMLVALESCEVVGAIMAGYDGHRGWISRVAVRKARGRNGLGRALMIEAERRLRALGCIKINLQVVAANAAVVGFYKTLGYSIEERVSMSRRLE